jgi:hypothetical protein
MRLTVLLLLVSPLPAFAKLEVRNVQPAHGLLGPARTSDDVFPLDEYFVRFQVAGVKPDKEGKTDLEVAVRLTNPDGKAVLDSKGSVQRPMSLGGDVFQTFARVTFPEKEKAPPGEYKLSVVVRDKVASESASFERKLNYKAPTFQILVPRFFHDADGKEAAGTTLFVGDSLHYQFKVVGYDKSQKKVGLVMRAEVLDAEGKDVGAKPLTVKGDITDAVKAVESRQATFTGTAYLHRPGEFKLKITVEDTVAKKTTSFETAIKVMAP